MLKISEFAELAHTTRRTLIIYDKDGLFKPALVNNEGYRFYEYNQVYELSFILALRKLGLSIDEIKQISSADKKGSPDNLLISLQSKINDQISDLVKIRNYLNQRKTNIDNRSQIHLYQTYENINQESFFWKSTNLKECSSQEIAKAFSEFYEHLDNFIGINGECSGFLTELPEINSDKYDSSSFSLIKATSVPLEDNYITTITRPAGKYIAIDVENDEDELSDNVHRGLKIINQVIKDSNLHVSDQLWEINLGEDIRFSNATSSAIRLEFQILQLRYFQGVDSCIGLCTSFIFYKVLVGLKKLTNLFLQMPTSK